MTRRDHQPKPGSGGGPDKLRTTQLVIASGVGACTLGILLLWIGLDHWAAQERRQAAGPPRQDLAGRLRAPENADKKDAD